jgi:hypothetical protein
MGHLISLVARVVRIVGRYLNEPVRAYESAMVILLWQLRAPNNNT